MVPLNKHYSGWVDPVSLGWYSAQENDSSDHKTRVDRVALVGNLCRDGVSIKILCPDLIKVWLELVRHTTVKFCRKNS